MPGVLPATDNCWNGCCIDDTVPPVLGVEPAGGGGAYFGLFTVATTVGVLCGGEGVVAATTGCCVGGKKNGLCITGLDPVGCMFVVYKLIYLKIDVFY